MNTVIIHTLRTRLRFNNVAKSPQGQSTGQGQDQGEGPFCKNEEHRKTDLHNIAICHVWFL